METTSKLRVSDESFVWFSGVGLTVGLLMVVFLLGLVLVNGLGVFWPKTVARVTLKDGSVSLGEIAKKRAKMSDPSKQEWQIYTGNKDVYGLGFKYVDVEQIARVETPKDAVVIERVEYGDAIGLMESAENSDRSLKIRLADGSQKTIGSKQVVSFYYPNALSWTGKVTLALRNFWHFVKDDPREANTEGGIFPAIFGTFVMTLLMSLAVTPFGVLAAIYLREYAKQGFLVRAVRIAVNNLAGVPSIVFGVFGLGFFVYSCGSTIDRFFFSDKLPTPTFGTGGILWASLTLALMTVPVVIVATEEALAAVSRGVREGSLACGASKWQTIQHIVLPASAPGILTGLILAMARGAGEVAPLMLVGVVKLAPTLPIDGIFPWIHLDRKFMHLGFHIYDLGFQSPDSEAAKPMIFATTLFLIALVVLLNMSAIVIRERLRRKYAVGAF
jgi:phosphate transport system permease protein